MSDDLVKRARHNAKADMPHHASVSLIEEMAERIEELEAKLAKAVEALECISETGHEYSEDWAAFTCGDTARTTLAELSSKTERTRR